MEKVEKRRYMKLWHDVLMRDMRELKPKEFITLLSLRSHLAYKNDKTLVSNETISNETGYNVKTVIKAMKGLVDNGYITRQRRMNASSITIILNKEIDKIEEQEEFVRFGD